MFDGLRSNGKAQLLLGLCFGIVFGVFLQKAGVTHYEVIIGQLLLTDFTVLKVMMSAVVVGMIGVHLMHFKGIVNLHVRGGSFGGTVVGALVFGAGFGLLGYCPGTAAGAVGHGAMDALVGGIGGLLFGSWLFAVNSERLESVLSKGPFAKERLQEVLHTSTWVAIVVVAVGIIALLVGLESLGL